MAKQVDIDKEKRKLEEMANEETYSDEQREEVRASLQRFQDEQKAINDQIRILKGRYSNQIYQIRESITKFLDKETGTLGERIRTLFKEQGVTIVSILMALGMTLGVLIEALLGGPSVSTTASGSTSGDKKDGAREWIENKLKALSQLPCKLAFKALAVLPGIIGSILSWILNRANRKNDLILIMTPEKQDKTLELSKHWSANSTLASNEVIMKRTYPVKSAKCDKICSNH